MAKEKQKANHTPQTLSKEKKKEIVEALGKKDAPKQCPICQENNWTIADGYFNQGLQTNLRGMTIGGPSIPSIAIICTNCGFMSQHALGILGLLPKDEEES